MSFLRHACRILGATADKAVRSFNDYHKEVCSKISPYLTVDEKEWLETKTAAI